jgi:hypothetical protein
MKRVLSRSKSRKNRNVGLHPIMPGASTRKASAQRNCTADFAARVAIATKLRREASGRKPTFLTIARADRLRSNATREHRQSKRRGKTITAFAANPIIANPIVIAETGRARRGPVRRADGRETKVKRKWLLAILFII